MDVQDCNPGTPDNTMSELASIKTLLQGIAADVSSVKTGLEMLQTTVEQLGARVTEAETGISDLEKTSDSRGASIDFTISNLKKLQDKVTVLEDAGRWNNVCVVGIPENAEKQGLSGYVLNMLVENSALEKLFFGLPVRRGESTGRTTGSPSFRISLKMCSSSVESSTR